MYWLNTEIHVAIAIASECNQAGFELNLIFKWIIFISSLWTESEQKSAALGAASQHATYGVRASKRERSALRV